MRVGREKRGSLTRQLLRILLVHEGPASAGLLPSEGTRCLPPRAPSRRGPPGVLLQGVRNRNPPADRRQRTADKVYGNYLTPCLHGIDPERQADGSSAGVEVDETLLTPDTAKADGTTRRPARFYAQRR